MKKIALIGAPLDLGSSELGVKNGPQSIRKAGIVSILKQSDFEVKDFGDVKTSQTKDLESKLKNLSGIYKSCVGIKAACQKALNDNFIPLTIGGDHSIALGSVAASLEKYPDINLLWIDAHPDINTPETTPSGNIHGMVTSSLMGYGNKKLTSVTANKLKTKNLYLLGVKDADKEELEIINKLNIYSLSIQEILLKGFGNALGGLFSKLSGKKLHVSLDLDSIDILDAPGVGIPSRGGFDYREIKYIAQEVSKLDVVAIDVVELNPKLDNDKKTAKLAIELAVTCLGGNYSHYSEYLNTQK
jgi:arginase